MNFLSLKHFNVLKGIGIAFVMISHIGDRSGLTWFTPFGGIGVALFLFCSGYGLYCSFINSGLKNYWKKKIFGVYSAYFLIELVMAFVLGRGIKAVTLDVLLIKPAYVYGWYMQYLFVCYLLFWLIFRFIEQEKMRLILLFTLAISSFFMLDGLRGEQAFSFVGGIVTAIAINKKKVCFKYGKVLAFIILFISIGLLALKQLPIVRQQNPYILTFLNILIKSFAAASIIYLTYAFKFINKISSLVFSFLGEISFSLYLIHGYLFFIVFDNLLGNYLINSAVFVILSLIVAYVVNICIKRIRKILYKHFM